VKIFEDIAHEEYFRSDKVIDFIKQAIAQE